MSRRPDPHGRGSGARTRASEGFTLVEMMIALFIFGMLTAAGVTLLSLTARTQEASDRLLAELGELRRTGALLSADLGQAAPRLYRDRDGRRHRAFAGDNGEGPMLMAFVRRGWDGGDGAGLQRVAWRLREGRLERLGFARVDGGGTPVAVTLLDGIRTLRLRYRDDDGAWHDRWDPTDESRLPEAVELVTSSDPHGTVRQLFLVSAGSP